jgi:hypothetical protein
MAIVTAKEKALYDLTYPTLSVTGKLSGDILEDGSVSFTKVVAGSFTVPSDSLDGRKIYAGTISFSSVVSSEFNFIYNQNEAVSFSNVVQDDFVKGVLGKLPGSTIEDGSITYDKAAPNEFAEYLIHDTYLYVVLAADVTGFSLPSGHVHIEGNASSVSINGANYGSWIVSGTGIIKNASAWLPAIVPDLIVGAKMFVQYVRRP